MGVASGCGEQEAGVASGSGWNLLEFLKCFSFLFQYFFVNKFYVLKKIFHAV